VGGALSQLFIVNATGGQRKKKRRRRKREERRAVVNSKNRRMPIEISQSPVSDLNHKRRTRSLKRSLNDTSSHCSLLSLLFSFLPLYFY